MTSYGLQQKSGKYWISDISGSIEAVFLKIGIINVHEKRNEMTPLELLHDNSFAAGGVLIKTEILSFVLKQKPSTPPNLMMEMKTIWELCLFQIGLSVSL